MDDFDIAQSKIGESAQRVVDRAVEESRRRDHALLTNEHIFLAFAQVEWDTFSQVDARSRAEPARDPAGARGAPRRCCRRVAGRELRVAPATKLVFKLAFHQASRAGRQTIESSDLFPAIFEESQGVPVSIIRRHGVEPDVLVSRIATQDARQRAARGAAAQALRAAAVPQALRDEPEPAGAPGQDRRRSTAATTRSSRCWRSSATASARTR